MDQLRRRSAQPRDHSLRDYEVHELPSSANIVYIHDKGGSGCTGCQFKTTCPNCCGGSSLFFESPDVPDHLPPWTAPTQ